jgi:hypothetical protein
VKIRTKEDQNFVLLLLRLLGGLRLHSCFLLWWSGGFDCYLLLSGVILLLDFLLPSSERFIIVVDESIILEVLFLDSLRSLVFFAALFFLSS